MTGKRREALDIVTDASGLINLFASGREEDVLRGAARRLVLAEVTVAEACYVVGPPDADGNETKLAIDLALLQRSGFVRVQTLSQTFNALYVAAATELTDRDAQPVAIAVGLGLALWSDDAKQKRVARALKADIEVVSTLALIRAAVENLDLPAAEVRAIAQAIRTRGRFLPPRRDPDGEWFMRALEAGG